MTGAFQAAVPDVLSLLGVTHHVVRLDAAAVGPAARVVDAGLQAIIRAIPPVVDVPADGLTFAFDWGALAGTDRVELASLTGEVQGDGVADFAGYPLGELAVQKGTDQLTVSAPGGRRIRAVNLDGLASGDVTFTSEEQLRAAGRRLTVSLRDAQGAWAAIASVPEVDRQGQVPPTLTGAGFAGGVLRLPDLAGQLKITIVEGATPAEFAAHPLTVKKVFGWAAPTPVDLTLTGPDGSTLWQFPGPLPESAAQSFDVTVAVAAAVEKLRAAGAAITGSMTLTSKFACKVRFRLDSVAGDLVRELPGTTTIDLAGEPVRLPLAAPLPPIAPAAVVADVKVTYQGKRLADVSDPMPPAGAHRGIVVRQDRVLRMLPPQALLGEQVNRIGLVGYCPQPTSVLVRLVPAAGTAVPGSAVPAIGPPGTVTVDAAGTVGVIWLDLAQPVNVDQPVAIEVSAGSGTLYWVTNPEPLVRIVVLDPDPAGRPVVLGDRTLLTVDQPTIATMRAALPAEAFSGDAPLLASALFCSVEITDAHLSYPRGA